MVFVTKNFCCSRMQCPEVQKVLLLHRKNIVREAKRFWCFQWPKCCLKNDPTSKHHIFWNIFETVLVSSFSRNRSISKNRLSILHISIYNGFLNTFSWYILYTSSNFYTVLCMYKFVATFIQPFFNYFLIDS